MKEIVIKISTGTTGAILGFLFIAAAGLPQTAGASSLPLISGSMDPAAGGGASSRAIVMFDHDVDASAVARLSDAGITHAVVLDSIDAVGVLGPRDSYEQISRWRGVDYVDDDSPVEFGNYTSKEQTHVVDVRAGKPPLPRGYTGRGVTVAVIDTGIDRTHPDLERQVAASLNFEPAWYMDDITDGAYSKQHAQRTGGLDTWGHGTHVAGIVAASGRSAMKVDMSGVAPDVTLVDLDVGSGPEYLHPTAFELNVLAAYQWLIDHRNDESFPGGIRIATNSWGIADPGQDLNATEEAATTIVRRAVRQGIVAVFSAQNEGPQEDTVAEGPNRLREVITVANACKPDTPCAGDVAESSGRGPQVDVAAPGQEIWSTTTMSGANAWVTTAGNIVDGELAPPGPSDPTAAVNNSVYYTSRSGTSMAAPHVAGIVALMLEANPSLSPMRVRSILTATATDAGKAGFDTAWGHGLVNAFRAVVAALRR